MEVATGEGSVRRLAVGGLAGQGDMTYVKFENANEVIRARTVGVPELANREWNPRDYRDKTILRIPSHQVNSVRIQLAGLESQEAKPDDKGVWQTTTALPAVLDVDALQGVLELVEELRAVRVEELSVRDPVAFGMSEPWATLTIGVENDTAINRVLLIGRRSNDGGRYAMLRGGDVLFALSSGQVSVLERQLVRKPML